MDIGGLVGWDPEGAPGGSWVLPTTIPMRTEHSVGSAAR